MPNEPPGAGAASHADSVDGRPRLSVIRGKPTDVELAAVIAVLGARSRALAAAAAAGRPAPTTATRSAWSMPSRLLRPNLSAGPGAWKRSAFPR